MLNLQSLYEKLRSQVDLLNENIEPSESVVASCFIFIACGAVVLHPFTFLSFLRLYSVGTKL